jgi:hypothetical protein
MRTRSGDEVDKRVCIKCEIEYPLNEKYFGYAHGTHTRFLTKCRECVREYQEEYRLKKQEEEQAGGGMHEIKEIPTEVQKRKLLKAFNYIHMQAFGEQMTEMIYWCKADEHVQITEDQCPKCNKTMEKIGFIDYNENGENK